MFGIKTFLVVLASVISLAVATPALAGETSPTQWSCIADSATTLVYTVSWDGQGGNTFEIVYFDETRVALTFNVSKDERKQGTKTMQLQSSKQLSDVWFYMLRNGRVVASGFIHLCRGWA